MFPVNDINFVVCGIATFAATVGYACSRSFASSPTSPLQPSGQPLLEPLLLDHDIEEPSSAPETLPDLPPTPPQIDQVQEPVSSSARIPPLPTRRASLKRKFDDEDDYTNAGYPHNLASIYPNKRSRTPSTESDGNNAITNETPTARTEDPTILPQPDSHNLIGPINTSQTLSPNDVGTEFSTGDMPAPPSPPESIISSPSPRPATPPQQQANPSRGFAAFAGSGSTFGSPRPGSPSRSKPARPVWCSPPSSQQGVFGVPTFPNAAILEDATLDIGKRENSGEPSNKNHDGEESQERLLKPSQDPLAAAEIPVQTTYTHLTGEEDEDVELELKNVKLFVKRGSKNFSDGMIGHIKLLSNKTTLDERLLFRREPLWKVSMNVRLQPMLRCTFDAEEHVLRLILNEPVEQEGAPRESWAREVVVYALKPGRSLSKQDFREFTEALLASPNLKPLAA